MAISDLDLPVIRKFLSSHFVDLSIHRFVTWILGDVLEHMEVKETLVSQVRQTFLDIIDARVNQQLSPEEVRMMRFLFYEWLYLIQLY